MLIICLQAETMLFSSEDIASKGTSPIFLKLDQDPELKLLSGRLKEFLKKDTILDLKPLEDIIVDPKEEILKAMSEKWMNNEYQKKTQTIDDYVNTAESIAKRW